MKYLLNWIVEVFFPNSVLYGTGWSKHFDKKIKFYDKDIIQHAAMCFVVASAKTLKDTGADSLTVEVTNGTIRGEKIGSFKITVEAIT